MKELGLLGRLRYRDFTGEIIKRSFGKFSENSLYTAYELIKECTDEVFYFWTCGLICGMIEKGDLVNVRVKKRGLTFADKSNLLFTDDGGNFWADKREYKEIIGLEILNKERIFGESYAEQIAEVYGQNPNRL